MERMGDWLGNETIAAAYDRPFKPFEKARKFVRKLGFRSRPQWYQYCKSGKRPRNIQPIHKIIIKNSG